MTTTWVGSEAPYTQEISVAGILSTDEPHITPVYSSTLSVALLEQEAWGKVGDIETSANKITLRCLKDKPTQAVTLQLEVIR